MALRQPGHFSITLETLKLQNSWQELKYFRIKTFGLFLISLPVLKRLGLFIILIHPFQFEPVIQPGHESYVHHMVLYECHVPGESTEEWFQHHAESGQGERCYSPNMPPEWTFCLATNTWAWVRINLFLQTCSGWTDWRYIKGAPFLHLLEVFFALTAGEMTRSPFSKSVVKRNNIKKRQKPT